MANPKNDFWNDYGQAGYWIKHIPHLFSGIGLLSWFAEHQKGISQAQNEANKELYQMEMDYNSAEAQKNRDYQTQMANTAHQREVADLRAAGLNPWLSVGAGAQSGVVSSSANSASAPKMEPVGDLAWLLSSAKDLALIAALGGKGK